MAVQKITTMQKCIHNRFDHGTFVWCTKYESNDTVNAALENCSSFHLFWLPLQFDYHFSFFTSTFFSSFIRAVQCFISQMWIVWIQFFCYCYSLVDSHFILCCYRMLCVCFLVVANCHTFFSSFFFCCFAQRFAKQLFCLPPPPLSSPQHSTATALCICHCFAILLFANADAF